MKGGGHDDGDDRPLAPARQSAATALVVADVLAHLTVTVQQTHRAIARHGITRLLPAPVRAVQDALTTLVYGTVRGGISAAGTITAAALDTAGRTRDARPWTGTPRGRRIAGMVDGAFGDRLAERWPALAGPMRVRVDGADVELRRSALAHHYPAPSPSVVVFLHGVVETEEWWTPPVSAGDPAAAAEDFGTRLTRDLGCSCVQVRYNSGLHVSDNGARLSDLLDELVAAWPVPVRQLALTGHSMGGLVARSALQQAVGQGREWSRRTRHLVCLGTPHTGAPLERGANNLAWLLRRFDESAPVAGLLAARSAGIKDLRHGSLDELDWIDTDPDALHRPAPPRRYRPPAGVEHANLAATVSRDPSSRLSHWVGDLLVPTASALAPVWLPAEAPPARTRLIGGLRHRDLLTDETVYAQLRDWLRT